MRPDFSRDVHCLLGLTFDAVDMAQAERHLLDAIASRERCFLSTPNLNFLIGCRADPAFRNSVLTSDLNVADGMPLVWLSRLLGIPIRERVAGSDLFDRITKTPKAIRVFFFGGMEGVAEAACRRMNDSGQAARCVGFETPGFGSIEEMSSDDTIARINASGADVVVVALGAKKGQAWIEHNLRRIEAPVVSHLGAVVNFSAGTLARAPILLQRLGLEWLWRIKEEPQLWRRYRNDGIALAGMLLTQVLPLVWWRFAARPSAREIAAAGIESRYDNGNFVIHLNGAWTKENISPLRKCLSDAAHASGDVLFDMRGVTYLDSAALGLLLLLHGWKTSHGARGGIVAASRQVHRILRYAGAGYLYEGARDASTMRVRSV